MANYLLLYSGGKMPESEAEQKANLTDWTAWFGKLGNVLVDGGNPFTPMARSIASDGKVSVGPVGSMASSFSASRQIHYERPPESNYLGGLFISL